MPSSISKSRAHKNGRRVVCHSGSESCRLRGFSLMELLIVMAIMAAMAAFTLRAQRGSLDKSRLRGAARDVRAAMGKARATAIREGVAVAFYYEVDGQRWQVRRTAPPLISDRSELEPRASNVSDPRDARNQDVPLEETPDMDPESLLVDEDRLSNGLSFVTSRDNLQPPADEEPDLETDLLPTALDSIRWAAPVRFRPNGRSENVALTIRGNRDFVVDLTVRGLTSAVSYTRPIRRKSGDTGEDLLPDLNIDEGL